MGSLLARALRPHASSERDIGTIDDYIAAMNQFVYNGSTYAPTGIQQTTPGEKTESIPHHFPAYVQSAYQSNGAVFACMLVRQMVFSAIRFQYQRYNKGKPSELWGDETLTLLERPWAGGTTQDLLGRMIQDNDLAGNFYAFLDTPLVRMGTNDSAEIVRLRPDWTQSVLQRRVRNGSGVGWRKIGYLYYEGGENSGSDPASFSANEVAHFAQTSDPLAPFRGMSWLTPVIRDIQNDGLMNRHKRKFFENAATPNVIVRMDPAIKLDEFSKFKAQMDSQHRGVEDAYKTLFVGAAADVTVAGKDFQQMDFKSVQGAGETRIAAAAGVPPVVVGLSEGLQGSSLNAGNYGQARRSLADRTMHPLWCNAVGSMQQIITAPAKSRLWYDARAVPFLREDEADAANIAFIRAQTLRQYTDAGWTPESAKLALDSGDEGLLVHSGFYSVQLQQPGAQNAPSGEVAIP